MLCPLCSTFDISALYTAAAQLVKSQPPRKRFENVFSQYDGIPDFHKHQPSLAALHASATSGCELCELVWTAYSAGKPAAELDEKLNAPVGSEDQIFLGLSQWAPASHGFPYVVASQYVRIWRPVATFEAFAARDYFPAGFEHLLARDVASSPASESCLRLATDWLRECTTGHKTCRKLAPSKKLPTRVVDVGGADGTQQPRIKVTDGLEADYIALSYCWGGDSVFIMKQERLEQWQRRIPFETFPATLRDAIVITRSLGVRYLWIDALCIIQDSKEDWAAEAAKMGDVYRNAIVTISAVASPKTDFGILKDRPPVGQSCQIPWKSSKDTHIRLISGTTFWDGSQKTSPLNTRGWTLQESLLAPRTLSYGSQQMLWECQERRSDEAGRPIAAGEEYRDKQFLQSLLNSKPSSTGKFLRKNVFNKIATMSDRWGDNSTTDKLYADWQQPYSKWLDIVVEYTSRNLTVSTDVLPALAGLAAAFQPVLEDQYCAGLWRNDMIRGLTWSRILHGTEDEPVPRYKRIYSAPSWSWASVIGRRASFSFPEAIDIVVKMQRAKILDVSLETSPSNPYGQITGGYMIIQGPLCPIDNPLEGTQASAKFPTLQNRINAELTTRWARLELNQTHSEHPGQKFAALQLQRYTTNNSTSHDGQEHYYHVADFLILETVAPGMDEYRRITPFHLSSHSGPEGMFWEETVAIFKEVDELGGHDAKVKII